MPKILTGATWSFSMSIFMRIPDAAVEPVIKPDGLPSCFDVLNTRAVALFVYGFLVHGILLAPDYVPYPEGVYRSGDAAKSHMLYGLAGIFIAIIVSATIYASSYKGGRGLIAGARLGLLFGVFIAGAFVSVNYGTINTSGKLALELAIGALIEWTMAGVLVGILYKP